MCLHLQELGPLSPHEVSTLALFLALVLVWLLRRPGFMPGWADMLQWTNEEGGITNTALLACLITDELLTTLILSGSTISISSATPTLLIVVLFFIIPADPVNDPK